MVSKPTDAAAPFLKLGSQQGAMLKMQKELLHAYEEASRTWFTRVKSEADLWSDLANKLAATRSVPEALSVYQQYVAERMQLAAGDTRRMLEECQKITERITNSLSSEGSTTNS